MSDRTMSFYASDARTEAREAKIPKTVGAAESSGAERKQASETGVHPVAAKIAVGAVIWFLAVTWLSFAWGQETDFVLVIVMLFFAFFIGLFLLTASFSAHDPRWPVRETSFRKFLAARCAGATS